MEGRLTPHLHLTKPDASSRLDAGVANARLRQINVDLDLIDAAIAELAAGGGGGGGLTEAEADLRYVRFVGGSVMTGALAPESDFGTDLGTASRRFDTVRAAHARLTGDVGLNPPLTTSGDPLWVKVGGEPFLRLTVGTDGLLRWGAGATERDASLGRTGPGTLGVSGALTVAAKAVAADPAAGNVLVWNAGGFYVPTPPAGGMSNPMTTLGDLITGGAAGAPGRLGVGATDQVLTVVAGAPAWANPAATANLLSNPGFEVWQRGSGPFTAASAWGPDRWQLTATGSSSMSVSRDGTSVDAGSQYCAAVTNTVVGGFATVLRQRIESVLSLRGRTVTFRVRVKAAASLGLRAIVTDSVLGTRQGALHTGSGGYETLTVTAPIDAAATAMHVGVVSDASGTYYVDNASLVVGSAPLAYAPPHPADDLVRCQRYYQEIGGLDNNEVVGMGQCFSATTAQVAVRLGVEMAVAPTATVSAPGDWHLFDAAGAAQVCTAVTFGLLTRRSFRIAGTVAGGLVAGNATWMRANSTAAARIRLEADPP